MRKVTISSTARDELRLIIEYLSVFGVGTATSFASEFDKKIESLEEGVVEYPIARHPDLAAAGYHVVLVKNYLALYRIDETQGVVVAHVFHQSQNYATLVLHQSQQGGDMD